MHRPRPRTMVMAVFALAFVLGLLLEVPAARAGGGYYVTFSYGYPYYWGGWYRRPYWPYWGYYGPPPFYYAPPPVYYVSPREQYCVQDKVYRYLPDGRIQWGTRTRCY